MNSNYALPSFHSLAEEYLRRRRAEGTYSVEEFADEFPHLHDEILSEFPGLVVAESLHEKEVQVTLPQTLGRYKLGQEMGRGAMGIVVAATNPDLESEIAIKLLPFERIKTMDMLHRFHTEAKICAAMEHPNIVPVFDYGTDDKFAFLAMRKVIGKSLDKVIAELASEKANSDSAAIQLDWDFITSIGIQAADALHYAHEQGVIHRDIKPANLILEENGRIWVSDFGLSKVLSSDVNLSMTGDVLGTPKYMAPEQLRGVYNVCSDVYSLGMTLYELVAVQPFWDPAISSSNLLANKQKLVLPDLKTLNPAVPDALCQIIMQAVELNPEDRFATAKELGTALKQSGSGSFIGDRRSSDRKVRRRSNRLLAMSVAAGMIASAGVYMLMPGQDELLSNVLERPEAVKEIFSQEDTRNAIIKKVPDLIETAFKTDDKELRTLLADLTADFLTEDLASFDQISPEHKAEQAKSIEQIRKTFIETGLKGDAFAEAVRQQREELVANLSLPKHIESMRSRIRVVDMPEEWKNNAQQQLSRYLAATKNESLFVPQQYRIQEILHFVLEVESDENGQLSTDGLRYFISLLEKELNSIGKPDALAKKVPHFTRLSQGQTGLADSRQRSLPNLDQLLKKAQETPAAEELFDKVTQDPRFTELLEKVQATQKEK